MEQTSQAWAEITIKEWIQSLKTKRIGSSFRLMQSFHNHVSTAAGGDLHKIEFAYLLYGMFVDMGVGKGTGIEGVRENATERRLVGRMRGNARKPKKWTGKVLTRETFRLMEIFAKKYGDRAIKTISDNIPETV
ncbi:hypothetical protein [Xanthocytophaga agilis]|uniref:Uncharacterized protein n=1 Tax=Xanthocytophaga agilis TaxID=3048010 RepID=A0AAE3R2J4_9BACT|nr:hypothetical protein [Xanthocytophaga agilis]MDJ1500449.1 hypothetical protein [Xanthocytophaga agilis]